MSNYYEEGYYEFFDGEYIRINDVNEYFRVRRENTLYEYDGYSMNKINDNDIGFKSYVGC